MGSKEQAIEEMQRETCLKYGVEFCPLDPSDTIGIAKNVRGDIPPLNGLRHPQEGCASGWFVYKGTDWSDDDDFFEPLHFSHAQEWIPMSMKYLALPPGWRFLVAEGYEDVWFDGHLLSNS